MTLSHMSVMQEPQSFGRSLKEAAKGLALFSALTSLFMMPLLSCAFLFFILAEVLHKTWLFPVGIFLGLVATVFSVFRVKDVMQQYNIQLWK